MKGQRRLTLATKGAHIKAEREKLQALKAVGSEGNTAREQREAPILRFSRMSRSVYDMRTTLTSKLQTAEIT